MPCPAYGNAERRIVDDDYGDTVILDTLASLIAKGFGKVDYPQLRAANDLGHLTQFNRPARLLTAAWLGQTGLIDNIALTP